MARINIAGLVGKTNKAGITSWYWQPSKTLRDAGWEALKLGKNEGAAIAAARARNEEVENWKTGGIKPNQVRVRIQAGTFGALVGRYRKEVVEGLKPNGKPRLRPKTKETYETALKRLEAWAGGHPVAFVTAARVRALRDATAKPQHKGGLGHSAAYNLLKTLRQVMAFAERIDVIPKGSNPAREFELGAPAPRSTVFELEDDQAFDAAAYDLGLPSMALARELALYSAQRESDLIAMNEGQLAKIRLYNPALVEVLGVSGQVTAWCFSQMKTSTDEQEVQMEIPLEPEILARVETAIRTNRARDRAATPPRLQTHVLVNDRTGLPWKKRHFISTWQKILNHAADRTGRENMRGLVWHDLRRTRVVRLRRLGLAKEMIAALTGHSMAAIDAMLRVYGPVDPTMTASTIAAALTLTKSGEDLSNNAAENG